MGPVKIQPIRFPEQIKIGSSITILCQIEAGTRPFEFQWLKDNRTINKKKDHLKINSHNQFSTLTLDPVNIEDEGQYTCVVKSSDNTFANSSARLSVSSSPSWVKRPKDKKAVVGSQVIFSCQAEGYPEPRVSWTKVSGSHSDLLQFGGIQTRILSNVSFVIHDIRVSDAGHYKCEVENGVGKTLSAVATLTMTNGRKLRVSVMTVLMHLFVNMAVLLVWVNDVKGELFEIIPFSFPDNVRVGGSTTVLCTVNEGKSGIQFQWFYGEKEIGAKMHKVKIVNSETFSALEINPVEVQNQGNYTCVARTAKNVSRYTTVLALKASPEWKHEPMDVRIKQLSHLRLECSATGYPIPTVRWTRNKESSLENLSATKFSEENLDVSHNGKAVLEVKKTTEKDEGFYICTADNGVAEPLRKSVRVTVIVSKFLENIEFITPPRLAQKSYSEYESLCSLGYNVLNNGVRNDSTNCANGVCFTSSCSPSKSQVTLNYGEQEQELKPEQQIKIPTIMPFSFPQNMTVGGYAKVFCAVQIDTKQLSFKWMKNGEVLTNARERVYITNNFDYSALELSNAQIEDNGNYTCQVKSPGGISQFTVALNLKGAPLWIKKPTDKTVEKNSDVYLDCLARGSPQPSVTWFIKKGNSSIKFSSSITNLRTRWKIFENGTLRIRNSQKKDEGEYSCIVRNDIGKDLRQTAVIRISGRKELYLSV
ncbi:cell adhesion molecule DSCAM-like [Tachypleus tridentatus]|uniref:cell adhesion molecule DSCAM-like n=1 Tax=Tachypleus tridentatus TaxID=6853 RepID=UPI003FCFDC6B